MGKRWRANTGKWAVRAAVVGVTALVYLQILLSLLEVRRALIDLQVLFR